MALVYQTSFYDTPCQTVPHHIIYYLDVNHTTHLSEMDGVCRVFAVYVDKNSIEYETALGNSNSVYNNGGTIKFIPTEELFK